MVYHDFPYLDALQHIMLEGEMKSNRTGVDTKGVFGLRMNWDLDLGFPLMTTKKIHTKSLLWELLWFIRGDTNIKWLNERKVRIWDEWSDCNGNLGPVYGHAWRNFGGEPESICQPKPKLPDGVNATYASVANGSGSEGHPLKKTWQGMIQRCYDYSDIGYPLYGARGVSVCNRWLEFKNFASDAPNIPGWQEDVKLNLDKDLTGDGFVYSPESCQWLTPSENSLAKSRKIYRVEKDGVVYSFANPSVFCRQHGISDKNFSDLWTGNKNAAIRYGYKLLDVIDKREGIDQLRTLVSTLRENPNDRRMVVSAWDLSNLKYMALPPCHMFYQVYVRKGEYLDLQIYQRSCDMFLGVPFNIASYATLTHILAHLAGLKPGRLFWVGGDCHIYENHFEQVRTQMSREPRPSPQLILKDAPTELDANWDIEHFELVGYDPHPAIKAEVAV